MSTYEVISTIVIAISIAINVFQFRQRKPKLKIQMCRSIEPNQNGGSNYQHSFFQFLLMYVMCLPV